MLKPNFGFQGVMAILSRAFLRFITLWVKMFLCNPVLNNKGFTGGGFRDFQALEVKCSKTHLILGGYQHYGKKLNVIPSFEKGERHKAGNYRPFSLIFENIMLSMIKE